MSRLSKHIVFALLAFALNCFTLIHARATQVVYPPIPKPGPPSNIDVDNIRPVTLVYEPHHSPDKTFTQYTISGADKPSVIDPNVILIEFQRVLSDDQCQVLPNDQEFFVKQPIVTCRYNDTLSMLNLSCYERPTEYPRQILDLFFCRMYWYIAYTD